MWGMRARDNAKKRSDDLLQARYGAVQARRRAQLLRGHAERLMAQLCLNLAVARQVATERGPSPGRAQ